MVHWKAEMAWHRAKAWQDVVMYYIYDRPNCDVGTVEEHGKVLKLAYFSLVTRCCTC
jgi:hypothetical protein